MGALSHATAFTPRSSFMLSKISSSLTLLPQVKRPAAQLARKLQILRGVSQKENEGKTKNYIILDAHNVKKFMIFAEITTPEAKAPESSTDLAFR